jgi:hypothetical protein
MRPQPRGLALSACVLATLAACGQAFTAGGPDDGGGDASSDSPGAGEGSSGGDAVTGDASGDTAGDGIGHDAVAKDGPRPHDAPSSEGSADGVANDVVVGPSKLVFITSQLYNGNMGGLSGADTLCQKLAVQASRPGTFKAWLSSTATSAGQRLTHSTGPYVLSNGTQIAANWVGLTSGTLLSPINVTETGGPAPTPTIMCSSFSVGAAWTSTAADGTLATTLKATCSDWTTSGPSNGAVLGVADQTGPSWTDGCGAQSAAGTSAICVSTASLYCIEQ